jgi:TonB family protein
VNDPVSELLARRQTERLAWKGALGFSLTFHLALVATVLLAPVPHGRALTLPRVEVRLMAIPQRPPAAASKAETKVATAKPRPATVPPVRRKAAPHPPKRVAAAPAKRARAAAPPPPAQATARSPEPVEAPAGGPPEHRAVGLGRGQSGSTDEAFPYAYYLDRVLATIEANWFRPPAPADARCRVSCRIDRSGRVLQVGLEVPSAEPAFDRAALRAVYAAAPFPPLPQGYVPATLTLHLEFGP